jgi:hypothetical protein
MFKKALLLAAAAGFVMSSSAFAVENSNKDLSKANQPTQMNQQKKASDTMTPAATTGAGTTSADPRDSNATAKTPADKAKIDDAKQKQ